jgi:hypothetical protein
MDDGLRRFEPGESVVLRYITRFDSQPGMSWPYRVVEDRDDLLALYIPKGAQYARWGRPPQPGAPRGPLELDGWRRDVLRLMFPGKGHSIWLFWERDDGGKREFTSYYVNMEEPFRRTEIGFDTNDHTLDIIVRPDLSWQWKDEEQFEGLLAAGRYTREFGEFVRAEGLSAVDLIEGRRSPFGDGWETWEPPGEWEPPSLPGNWKDVPARVWERRDWAYR